MRPIDHATEDIYRLAERAALNSWMRTLVQIRQAPTTWPTRWPKAA